MVLSKENANQIVQWYQANKRKMPWRDVNNPYYTWISEIMLQQTRIEAVMDYYQRFIIELPTLKDLAEVSDDRLLKLWEGLGYYSRAKNLKKSAVMVMENYNGQLPNDFDLLKKLPGIGDYTAGAIASIAYNLKAPAVDGNVLRVLTRFNENPIDIRDNKVKEIFANEIKPIIPNEAGDFTQGIMELGETVCLPNTMPLCEKCPLKKDCKSYAHQTQMQFPVISPKPDKKIEEKTVLIVKCGEEFCITKRPLDVLLGGLYEFLTLDGYKKQNEINDCLSQIGFQVKSIKKIEKATHIFTHIKWEMHGYLVEVENKIENNQYIFASNDDLVANYAIPSAYAKYKKYIE